MENYYTSNLARYRAIEERIRQQQAMQRAESIIKDTGYYTGVVVPAKHAVATNAVSRTADLLDAPRQYVSEKLGGLEQSLIERLSREKQEHDRLGAFATGIALSSVAFVKGAGEAITGVVSPRAWISTAKTIGTSEGRSALLSSLKNPVGAAEFLGGLSAMLFAGKALSGKKLVSYDIEPKTVTGKIVFNPETNELSLIRTYTGKAVKTGTRTPSKLDNAVLAEARANPFTKEVLVDVKRGDFSRLSAYKNLYKEFMYARTPKGVSGKLGFGKTSIELSSTAEVKGLFNKKMIVRDVATFKNPPESILRNIELALYKDKQGVSFKKIIAEPKKTSTSVEVQAGPDTSVIMKQIIGKEKPVQPRVLVTEKPMKPMVTPISLTTKQKSESFSKTVIKTTKTTPVKHSIKPIDYLYPTKNTRTPSLTERLMPIPRPIPKIDHKILSHQSQTPSIMDRFITIPRPVPKPNNIKGYSKQKTIQEPRQKHRENSLDTLNRKERVNPKEKDRDINNIGIIPKTNISSMIEPRQNHSIKTTTKTPSIKLEAASYSFAPRKTRRGVLVSQKSPAIKIFSNSDKSLGYWERVWGVGDILSIGKKKGRWL